MCVGYDLTWLCFFPLFEELHNSLLIIFLFTNFYQEGNNKQSCNYEEPDWVTEQCKQIQANQFKSEAKMAHDLLAQRSLDIKKLKEGCAQTNRTSHFRKRKVRKGISFTYHK